MWIHIGNEGKSDDVFMSDNKFREGTNKQKVTQLIWTPFLQQKFLQALELLGEGRIASLFVSCSQHLDLRQVVDYYLWCQFCFSRDSKDDTANHECKLCWPQSSFCSSSGTCILFLLIKVIYTSHITRTITSWYRLVLWIQVYLIVHQIFLSETPKKDGEGTT